MKKNCNIAVCGATGAVGRQMIRCLEERNFPFSEIRLFASKHSLGKRITIKGKDIEVEVLREGVFETIDIALFSAGSVVSKKWAPVASSEGAIVVDNSSVWRMDPQVPLVIPECNIQDIAQYKYKGIIANPNCSTIQMLVVLQPLHLALGIKRIVVTTFQAVSGTGQKAIRELENQQKEICEGFEPKKLVYSNQIANNLFPHIGSFLENGYTEEEMKLVNETRKILHDSELMITATCSRVPVYYGHSEAVNVTFLEKVGAKEVREILEELTSVKVVDDLGRSLYPTPLMAASQDFVLVGRIRDDISQENGVDLWIVADNIRKGAATNAVQIAENLLQYM